MFVRSIVNRHKQLSFVLKSFNKNCLFTPNKTSFTNIRLISKTNITFLGRKVPLPEENDDENIILKNRKILNSSLTLLEYKNNNSQNVEQNRKLVVLIGWLLSKDRNMEKYAKIYAKHNFDTLLVKTHPKQLIFPKNGSIKNAKDILDFLVKNKNYSQVLFHGFSIGGYQFGEVLAILSQNPEIAGQIIPIVKACVFDSAVDLHNLAKGFSSAMTENIVLRNIFYFFMASYLKLFYFVATKYYKESEREFYAMKHFAVPSLMFVSERDKVGSIESNKLVMDSWIKRGVPVKMKIFKDSKHVCHYKDYPQEYENEILQILQSAKLIGN